MRVFPQIAAFVIVADGAQAHHVVLKNLSHVFIRPNVIDVKLGTVLWDAHAIPEKRARMERAARETTSFATGIRLTGFKVFNISPRHSRRL
jgi:1D-myo-inositol-tetrakisphosphate 5-kinase/inositol-polyphosphate multikinase